MEKTPIHLKLTAVSKSFGPRKVVDSLDLEVRQGEIFCIFGASGCGKTTLLRMVAGLETPERGSIEIAGVQVVEDGQPRVAAQDRQIGFVFQDLALWPHLTVAGNLNFVLGSKKVPKSLRATRICEILERVHLVGSEKAYPETLSGGEQQRLAIARALIGNPTLILLDEPLSSLDHQLRIRLQQELLRWVKDLRVTAIWVTHNQAEALTVADRVGIIHQGRLVRVGAPELVGKGSGNDFIQ